MAGPAPTGPVLRDLHLPGEPSWFPPAPGWWLLAVLLIIAAIVLLRYWQRRRRRRWVAGAAYREWLALKSRYQRGAPAEGCLRELSALLRRAALRIDGDVAQLHGSEWARWLDQQLGREAFAGTQGEVLIEGVYRNQPVGDLSSVMSISGELIRQLERRT